MYELSIGAVMTSPVETVDPGESARAVATRLADNEFGSLVVSETGTPVGIVTYTDITRLVSDGRDPDSTAVEEIMSTPLVTIHEDELVGEAAKMLREHGIKRLPVVDDDGTVVGIATTTDLANYIPHLMGTHHEPETPDRSHQEIRSDIAYEKDEWTHEYLGSEATINVGDKSQFTKRLSEEDVEAFAEASGDTNRLHLDEEYAERTRFGTRIAHGTLVVGLVSAALARLPGLTIYLAQDVSYLGPVELGDEVTADCEVVEHMGENRYRLTTTVAREDGEVVVDGEAVVMSDEVPDVDD